MCLARHCGCGYGHIMGKTTTTAVRIIQRGTLHACQKLLRGEAQKILILLKLRATHLRVNALRQRSTLNIVL